MEQQASVLKVHNDYKAKTKREKNQAEYLEAIEMLEQILSKKIPPTITPAIKELITWLQFKVEETSTHNKERWFEPVRIVREQTYSRIYGNWMSISTKAITHPELKKLTKRKDKCENMKEVVQQMELYSEKYGKALEAHAKKYWKNITEAIKEAVQIEESKE